MRTTVRTGAAVVVDRRHDMALSIVEVLLECGEIDQDALAESFRERFDPRRGYGAAMYELVPSLERGRWDDLARQLFGGSGSYGNGAAMRVAPLGAFFAEDVDRCVEQAERSALVTHTHPEAVAGAIAVALAAALAPHIRVWLDRRSQRPCSRYGGRCRWRLWNAHAGRPLSSTVSPPAA